MEEEIELRDNFNQDTLDKTPGWLMKWGVIAVALAIIALLSLAAVIPYDQTIRFPITFGNEAPTYVISPQGGTLLVNRLAQKPTVHKGDTLLVISTPAEINSYVLAPATGVTVYTNHAVLNANQVTAGDTLVKILPIINTLKKVTAVGYYDKPIPEDKLQTSQVVIKIAEPSGNTVTVKSNILYASVISEAGKGHMVVIEPDSNSISQLNTRAPVYHGLQVAAVITLKKRSIIQWIFD